MRDSLNFETRLTGTIIKIDSIAHSACLPACLACVSVYLQRQRAQSNYIVEHTGACLCERVYKQLHLGTVYLLLLLIYVCQRRHMAHQSVSMGRGSCDLSAFETLNYCNSRKRRVLRSKERIDQRR